MSVAPPEAVDLYFCPECGVMLTGTYNVDTGRKKCSKLWHKAGAVKGSYRREVPGPPTPPKSPTHRPVG